MCWRCLSVQHIRAASVKFLVPFAFQADLTAARPAFHEFGLVVRTDFLDRSIGFPMVSNAWPFSTSLNDAVNGRVPCGSDPAGPNDLGHRSDIVADNAG